MDRVHRDLEVNAKHFHHPMDFLTKTVCLLLGPNAPFVSVVENSLDMYFITVFTLGGNFVMSEFLCLEIVVLSCQRKHLF